MNVEQNFKTITWWRYSLIGAIGLIIICMISYSFYKAYRMNTVYMPLIEASHELMLEATNAHLWFEEILSGDQHENMDKVWKHLDQSNWYTQAMLEGGKNPEGTFIALKDTELRQKITIVQKRLAEFKNITKQRFIARKTSIAGTDIDQRYDNIFNDFITKAHETQTRLKQLKANDFSTYCFTMITLIVMSSLLSILVVIVFYRFDKIRSKNAMFVMTSLEKKKMLLRETHHRVKNNMSVVSSLLSLHSKTVEDNRLIVILKECQNRVKAISLVHEKLYCTVNLSNISFKDYFEDLAKDLFHAYNVSADKIKLKMEIEPVSIRIDNAVPIGLVVNELVSNSLKYAFPEGKEGEIGIFLKLLDTSEAELTIRDNGISLPKDIDYRNVESLGFQLVNGLTQQLGGNIELNRSKGTEFKIVFKV